MTQIFFSKTIFFIMVLTPTCMYTKTIYLLKLNTKLNHSILMKKPFFKYVIKIKNVRG